MARVDPDRERWIMETQLFQEIAGRTPDTAEELGAEWDQLYRRKSRKTKAAAAENAAIQRIILENAGRAGGARQS